MANATTEQIDREFDEGKDVLQYADEATFERPNQRRMSVDMPMSMIERLNARAAEAGVPRQALVKLWILERLNQEDEREASRKATLIF